MMSAASRRAGLAGLAMGPACLGLIAVSTWLQWDYLHSLGWTFEDHAEVPYPSATATGDWAPLTIGSFLLGALLAATLLTGLRREFRSRRASRIATVALAVYVASFVLLAFPTDVRTESPVTWHGWLHGFGFVGLLLSMLVGYAAAGAALRGNDGWRGWRAVAGWWPVLLVLALFTGFGLPGDTGWYLFLVLAFAWPAIVGLRLVRFATHPRERRHKTHVVASEVL